MTDIFVKFNQLRLGLVKFYQIKWSTSNVYHGRCQSRIYCAIYRHFSALESL